jgi:hypothetical protein
MEEISKSLKGRIAIRTFKITADALLLRGHYKVSGPSGQNLENALRALSPEIYGVINDPRTIDLKGLQYVLDRLPRGEEREKYRGDFYAFIQTMRHRGEIVEKYAADHGYLSTPSKIPAPFSWS